MQLTSGEFRSVFTGYGSALQRTVFGAEWRTVWRTQAANLRVQITESIVKNSLCRHIDDDVVNAAHRGLILSSG
jgi:hypothetical protein